MPTYKHPGVFVEEVSTGSKPISGVGTSTGAFVGVAERGPIGEPTLVTNWSEFVRLFGGYIREGYLAYAVFGFFNNGGQACFVIRVAHYDDITDADSLTAVKATLNIQNRDPGYPADTITVDAISEGEWGNAITVKVEDAPLCNTLPQTNVGIGAELAVLVSVGGLRENSVVQFDNGSDQEYVTVLTVTKATRTITWTGALTNAYPAASSMAKSMEFTLTVYENNAEKESWENLTMVDGESNYAETVINDPTGGSDYIRVTDLDAGDPGLDVPETGTWLLATGDNGLTDLSDVDFIGDSTSRTGLYGFDSIDEINLLSVPGGTSASIINAGLSYCETRRDVFFIADSPLNLRPLDVLEFRNDTGNFSSSFGALYFPWIEVSDPIGYGKNPLKYIPPSGHMQGCYARTDQSIGVEKTPAGEEVVVRGALGLDYNVNNDEQDLLNPAGINCIRSFSGRGIVVWGGRTLSPDPEWTYIVQRRSMIFLQESILEGTRWAVFQVNDPVLWRRLTVNLAAFLTEQWREGILYGMSAAEAFYVKCDEETNTTQTRETGKVITEIGVALQRPAEFVIFRIGQWKGGSSVEEV